MRAKFCLLVAASSLSWAAPALAGPGDPVTVAEGVTLDPILAARLRYEDFVADPAHSASDAGTVIDMTVRWAHRYHLPGQVL